MSEKLSLRVIENALIIPSFLGRHGSGILDSEGKFVAESMSYRNDEPILLASGWMKPELEIKGAHLYGGLIHHHFGHFLVEPSPDFGQ